MSQANIVFGALVAILGVLVEALAGYLAQYDMVAVDKTLDYLKGQAARELRYAEDYGKYGVAWNRQMHAETARLEAISIQEDKRMNLIRGQRILLFVGAIVTVSGILIAVGLYALFE